jgi:mannose-1-phosphate guanylyltransferase / mannose-6-phosphate isomerase
MSTPATPLYPIILCGGSGTRLWPMSRRLLPKQFLPLVSSRSMLQETVLRTQGIPGVQAPVIVGGDEHRFLVAEQLREVGAPPGMHLLEPVARNTAPAIAAAAWALLARDPAAVMLVLPADHAIGDVAAFRAAAVEAMALAEGGFLVTFGIVPTEAATGYGYIERGAPLAGSGFAVSRFVEKPTKDLARTLVDSGRYAWNSGMFMFRADRYLEELHKHCPAIHEASRTAYTAAQVDLDFCRLDRAGFEACPADSIDYAVMEKTDRAAMIPVDLGWSDVGSWSQIWAMADKDAQGNAGRGDVMMHDTRDTYVRAESRLVATVGVENLVVVETDDAVLIASRERAQDVRAIVDRLQGLKRSEQHSHARVYRPWGYYESIDAGERFQVKRIMVKPGQSLSLQMHHHRAEHWIVVSGTARVTRGEETVLLSENQSTYIPLGVTHRLDNPGKLPLYLIEVQSGSYLGEDDIVRFEDRYGR